MRNLILSGLGLFLLALAIPALAAQPAVPADGLKMDLVKKGVVFNHSSHKDIKCVECHHLVNDKEDFQKCAAAGCHDNLDRKDKSVHSYYRAIHGKKLQHKTCLSCHQEFAAAHPDQKKELTGCKQSKCHP